MFAGMSSGTRPPSRSPVRSSRMRYFVPKRWLPCDSDSEPIEDQPWFCRITRITFTRSDTIVAISCGAIWKVPSPMIATTSASGAAIFAPSEAGSSYPMHE